MIDVAHRAMQAAIGDPDGRGQGPEGTMTADPGATEGRQRGALLRVLAPADRTSLAPTAGTGP
jgi:hypothetical protein